MSWNINKPTILTLIIGFIGVVIVALLPSLAVAQPGQSASVYYKFDVMAKTGQAGLYSIEPAVSINDQGTVTFVGKLSLTENAIFIADNPGRPSQIVPTRSIAATPLFNGYSPFVQINNLNQVVAYYGEPAAFTTFTRIAKYFKDPEMNQWYWDSIASGQLYNVGANFHAVFDSPSINNNGEVIFSAFGGHHRDSWCMEALCLAKRAFASDLETPPDELQPLGQPLENPYDELQITSHTALRPMLADNGKAVAKDGNQPASPINLYNIDLSSFESIARSDYFTEIGRLPGISDNGRIVAFYGNLNDSGAAALQTTPGKGIFVSIDQGDATRNIERIVGWQIEDTAAPGGNDDGICDFLSGETCIQSPELGFNEAGTPIYLRDFDIDSRVAVIHQEFWPDDSDDTYIVSFVATPSEESRRNPVTQTPFSFSSQRGIWTVLVDVDLALQPSPQQLSYHPTSPLPVAQLDDVIFGNRITDLAIYDPLAVGPETDHNGNPRPQSRGDHRIAFWAATDTGSLIVRATHLDTDQDGLLDHWETDGIDLNQDGQPELNLPAMEADPYHRDLFLEIDWLAPQGNRDFSPLPQTIDFLVNMFLNAPGGGITLHVDAGQSIRLTRNMGDDRALFQGSDEISEAGTGRPIDVVDFGLSKPICPGEVTGSFDDIKSRYFGTTDQKTREFVFHYVILADRRDCMTTLPAFRHSGAGEMTVYSKYFNSYTIPGNDLLVTLEGNVAPAPYPEFLQAQTVAHELGHNLGLLHGGNDNLTSLPPDNLLHDRSKYNPAYISLMNYAYHYGLSGKVVASTATTLQTSTSIGIPFTGVHGDADLFGHRVLVRTPAANSQERYIVSNTAYELTVDQPWESPVPGSTDKFSVLVREYSQDDTVFNDWDNIKLDFQNYAHFLGNSFGVTSLGGYDLEEPPVDFDELERLFGPFDRARPTITIISPAPDTSIDIGSDLQVTLTVTDDIGVDGVEVSFDTDGDNAVGEPNETVLATKTGPDSYEAIFTNISGPDEVRIINVSATDSVSRTTFVARKVAVGDVMIGETAEPSVTIASPTLGTFIPLGSDLVVSSIVTDNVAVASITASFDSDGNGALDGPGETTLAARADSDIYMAIFASISGSAGPRTISVSATDTSGNVGIAHTTVMVGEAPDTTPNPFITQVSPSGGSTNAVGSVSRVSVAFSEPLNVATLTSDTFRLFSAGPDELIGTADDSLMTGGTLGYDDMTATASLTFTAPLPEDTYQATVSHSITNLADRPLREGITWTFSVAPVSSVMTPVGRGASVSTAADLGLGNVNTIAVSPNGTLALVGGERGGAALIQLGTGNIVRHFRGHTDTVNGVAFSGDGSRALTGSQDGTVRLWDVTTGTLLRTFARTEPWHRRSPVTSVAFSPNGAQVLAGVTSSVNIGDADNAALLWDVATGELLRTFTGHTSIVTAIAFSPTGDRVLTGSRDNSARLYNAETGAPLRTFSGHSSWINAVSFADDGLHIATGSADGTARIWNSNTGAFRVLKHPNSAGVSAVDFSPDGTRLLTANNSQPPTVHLWDVATGEQLHTYNGHRDEMLTAVFSPTGERILSSAKDGEVRVWDAQITPIRQFLAHDKAVQAVAVSADGTRLLTGSADNTARLWDISAGLPNTYTQSFVGHTAAVVAVAFSPDGTQVLTGSQDRTARFWNAATGQEIHRLVKHTHEVRAVAFSPDGNQIVTASLDGTTRVWDAATGREIFPLEGLTGQIYGAAFSPDGTRIATAGSDNTIRIWEAATGSALLTIDTDSFPVDVAYAPDGIHVFSGIYYGLRSHFADATTGAARFFYSPMGITTASAVAPDGLATLVVTNVGTGYLWEIRSGELKNIFTAPTDAQGPLPGLTDVVYVPDRSLALIAASNGAVYFWETRSGASLHTLGVSGHSDGVEAIALSPDGSLILSASIDQTARLWDATTGQPVGTLRGHRAQVVSAAFAPDSRRAATGDRQGEVLLWDVMDGTALHTFRLPRGNTNYALDLAFSPDGTQLLVGSSDTIAYLWNLATGEEVRTFEAHNGWVTAVGFSPDGSRILTGSNDDSAVLWDPGSGDILGSFGHTDDVLDVAFTPDGSQVLTVSKDGTAQLWDPAVGTPARIFSYLSPLRSAPSALNAGAFSRDGTYLATGDAAGVAHLWYVASGELLRVFEGHEPRAIDVAFTPDSTHIVTAGSRGDNSVRLWEATTATSIFSYTHEGSVNSVAFSPDGSRLLSAACNRTAARLSLLWDVETGIELHQFTDHGGAGGEFGSCVRFAAIARDGIHALTGTGVEVRLRDLTTYQTLHILRAHGFGVRAAVFSPDSQYVLTGGQDRAFLNCVEECASAKLWEVATGILTRTFSHAIDVTAVAFSPDGTQILTGSADGRARLWNVDSDEVLRVFIGHTKGIEGVAFAPDGSRVATGSSDQTVVLWDVASGTVLHRYSHPDQIHSLAFSEDGRLLVASSGNSAYVWNAKQGGLAFVVSQMDEMQDAVFSRDGTRLATANNDYTVRLWAVSAER